RAGDDIEGWQAAGFFHNAGITEEAGRDFCKLRYRNSDPARDVSRLSQVITTEPASYPLLDMHNQEQSVSFLFSFLSGRRPRERKEKRKQTGHGAETGAGAGMP